MEIPRGGGLLGQADEAIGDALQALLGRGVVRRELEDLAVLLQRVAAGRGRQPQGCEVGLRLCQEGGDVILPPLPEDSGATTPPGSAVGLRYAQKAALATTAAASRPRANATRLRRATGGADGEPSLRAPCGQTAVAAWKCGAVRHTDEGGRGSCGSRMFAALPLSAARTSGTARRGTRAPPGGPVRSGSREDRGGHHGAVRGSDRRPGVRQDAEFAAPLGDRLRPVLLSELSA